ncbi:uncharacterized protein Z520_11523 [Fonsecaea multimorphosa CBS 102226]|uniref:Uncharacterized protein n=1 Tax=Fonsecaea multimorphosa CBS 102226 TaxID=1442371 RepID=A0A0D2JQW2_9EURO|nr:uncharacterized protein Z520_11523 [Fonsecaea multimorphosa CBS 102226]KIX92859.1 hypothetical protein Z520_11523 [Fonsecaea multimorphosa CBS 102226]OAL18107.1 hypothetical protein AYO22_11030 [Fonsecaea multimorphosa]
MPRRGRPPGRRPRPPRDGSCSTCGENNQGDGAGQLPGYFGHGNLGEMQGPEFYPDPVTGFPNGPRCGSRGNGGGRGIGRRGNNNQSVVANAWGVDNDNGFEVWNNGQLVASGGGRSTRGTGPRGGGDIGFDFDDDDSFSDDFDDFGGSPFGRGPLGRGPRRGPGPFPPGMGRGDIPAWLCDEFDDDDFDDFEMVSGFGGRPPAGPGIGPRRGGPGGVRVTRQGGAIVIGNDFPPRGSGGQSGHDLDPEAEYDDDYDDDYDDFTGGSFGGRNGARIFRTRDGGTFRIHQR